MVDCIEDHNGTLTMDDLKDYSAIQRETIQMDYGDYRLYSMGAPSGGPVALNILKIMEQWAREDDWDVSPKDKKRLKKNKGTDMSHMNITMHRYVEAMRFAYAARTEMGDPAFVDGMEQLVEGMLDEKNTAEIKKKIKDDKTLDVKDYDPHGFYTITDHGTSHIVTADGNGMAVSLTTTVNLLFGSRLLDNVTGIIL